MSFPEDFLHYVWQFRQFKQQDLFSTDGIFLEILSPGIHNKNAGPDFENAKIRIGDTVWAGNVEIHLNSSDWQKHGHVSDQAYENVILHVVFNHDHEQFRKDGTRIPVLELKTLIPEGLHTRYQELMSNMDWIACASNVRTVDSFHISSWLSRVIVERLEERSKTIHILLEEFKGSWDDAFYVVMARNFGFKINAVPFEMLARSLPQSILGKHKNSPTAIEALIFGQAGFLNDVLDDPYHARLKTEYRFLKKKYSLQTVDKYLWKFLRLRPQNFPTVRLAQFSALVLKSNHLFSKILEITDTSSLKSLFTDLPVNDYWKNHYRFGVTVQSAGNQIGAGSINNILVNTIALFLFSYGKNIGKSAYVYRAIELLEALPPEDNRVVRMFSGTGIESKSAFASQALLQLKKSYCENKRCLQCGIGTKLLNL